MQNPPPVQTGKSSTGLDENVASLLSYIAGWLSGLIFFLIEKNSRLVRFHAMQAILLNVVAIVLIIAVVIIATVLGLILGQISEGLALISGLIGTLLYIAILLGIAVAWVMCLIKAYGGQMFKLPVIGNFAEKFSAPK